VEHGTDKPPEQPTPQPRQPHPILDQPATVETCQQDYAEAADVRRRLGWQDGA
jgi:hypothetical protein